MNTKPHPTMDAAKKIRTLWEQLSPDQFGEPISLDEANEWLAHLTTTRGGARWLRQVRKNAPPIAEVLHERLNWHMGRTNTLWGPMMSIHKIDKALWDRVDTFATIIGHLRGARSTSNV